MTKKIKIGRRFFATSVTSSTSLSNEICFLYNYHSKKFETVGFSFVQKWQRYSRKK